MNWGQIKNKIEKVGIKDYMEINSLSVITEEVKINFNIPNDLHGTPILDKCATTEYIKNIDFTNK